MGFEEQRPRSNTTHGRIILFLRRNLFEVELHDGQIITAVMPEELLPYGIDSIHQPAACWVGVKVRLRKRPRMHRIIDTYHSGLTC